MYQTTRKTDYQYRSHRSGVIFEFLPLLEHLLQQASQLQILDANLGMKNMFVRKGGWFYFLGVEDKP